VTAPEEQHQEQPDTVELAGGPLDGQRLDVTGWTEEERATGIAHLSPNSSFGPGGRSLYGPPEHDPSAPVWAWEGDMP
jgi:hypothetical protein